MQSNEFTVEDFEKYIIEMREFAKRAKPNDLSNQNVTNESMLYEEFEKNHPGRGTLKVQVSTAQGSIPVNNARVGVDVFYDGQRLVVYKNTTDVSGILDGLVLPALPKELSENYETAQDSGTEYLVSVYHDTYADKVDMPIKIYDKVETILPVNLLPEMR